MERCGHVVAIAPERISELWKSPHQPPHLVLAPVRAAVDGHSASTRRSPVRLHLNPWADFNLSGQFLSESVGPDRARDAPHRRAPGAHYTHVAIDLEGEPIRRRRCSSAMIATAFLTERPRQDSGRGRWRRRIPQSVMRRILADVRRWHKENPADWRATRRLIQQTVRPYDGAMRDRNGVELNGASTIAALLYGQAAISSRRCATPSISDGTRTTMPPLPGPSSASFKGERWMQTAGLEDQGRLPQHQPRQHAAGRDDHKVRRSVDCCRRTSHRATRRPQSHIEWRTSLAHPHRDIGRAGKIALCRARHRSRDQARSFKSGTRAKCVSRDLSGSIRSPAAQRSRRLDKSIAGAVGFSEGAASDLLPVRPGWGRASQKSPGRGFIQASQSREIRIALLACNHADGFAAAQMQRRRQVGSPVQPGLFDDQSSVLHDTREYAIVQQMNRSRHLAELPVC